VYCRSGNRSAAVAGLMAVAGLADLADLGVIQAWEQAGGDVTVE
jgi:rhodanese-related sulfurtransferase